MASIQARPRLYLDTAQPCQSATAERTPIFGELVPAGSRPPQAELPEEGDGADDEAEAGDDGGRAELLHVERLVLSHLGEGLGHGGPKDVEVQLPQYPALLQSPHLLVEQGLQLTRLNDSGLNQ